MVRAWLSGIVLLAVGCGGALSGGAGGAGGTASGGTTGSGGAAGRAPYEGQATWAAGDVVVSVGPTDAARATFDYSVRDLAADIVIKTTASLPSATSFPPTDGAYAWARYDCSSGLYQVDIESCPLSSDVNAAPGCIGMTLRPDGATGEYVDADGAACVINSAMVTMEMESPGDGSPEDDAARGSFVFNCTRADGALWYVDGRFSIALESVGLCPDPLR
jgi:hypothetical protein